MLLLSYKCIVTINVLWLFLTVPWVGLQCVIVVFPDHTHLHCGSSDIIICRDFGGMYSRRHRNARTLSQLRFSCHCMKSPFY